MWKEVSEAMVEIGPRLTPKTPMIGWAKISNETPANDNNTPT